MHSVSPRSGHFPSFQQWSPMGVLAGGIFIIDLLIPLGVAAGVLYLAVVLLSLRHRDSQLPLWTAVGCSILTITAFFISPVGGELWKVLMNRGLAIFAIWTTTLMGRIQLQQAGTIQQQDKSIQDFMTMLPSACFSFDRQGTILSWNPAAEKIYGYTQQEAVGSSSYDLLVTHQTIEKAKAVIDNVFQGAAAVDQIWHDRNKQGELGWRAGSLFPIFARNGQVAYGINFNIDITAQKNAESGLQQKHALLEAILNSSKDAIYAKDQSGKYLIANQAAADVMGKPPESLIGLDDIQIFGAEYGETLQQTDSIILTNNQNIQLEETIAIQGNLLTFSTTKSPLKSPNGNTIGLVGISRDITEWKKLQTDLLLTDRVFQASHDHISILGQDYRYRRVNPSYEKIHGYTSQEVVGMSVSDLLGQEIFDHIVKPKLDQCFQGDEVHYEAWFQFGNNQDHYMAVSYLPLMSENRDIKEIVVIARDMTERKRMEEALESHEQQLRTILDAMTNFVGIGTADGTITDCNQAPLTLAGLTREDVIGKRFTDTDWLNYSPTTQEQVRDIIQRVSQGEIVREDYQACMGDNGIVTVDACFVPVKDAMGQVQQIVHSGIDVTKRRQIEDAVKKSEQQFRDLYESAPLAYFSATWDGHITRVNVRASDLLGYSKEELIGKHVLTLYGQTKDGYEKASNIQKKTQEGISIQDEELEMRKKDGTILWVSLTVRLIFDESGEIIERRGIAQDISTRKKIESELRASEERFRTFFEAGLIGMGIISLEQKWLEVNDQLCSLLGYSQKELKLTTWAELTYPDDLALDQTNFESMRAGTVSSYATSKRYIRRDGSLMYANLYVNVVQNSSGQADYFTTMIEDVTEQKHGEALLMKWAMIFQHTQWAVGVSDGTSTNFEMVNEAYASMHGYAIRELEGMSVTDVVTPEFRIQFPNIIQTIHQDGFLSYEACHLRKDGSTFPALVTESAIKDINGQTLYRVTNVIDISELKSTEDALKKSDERLSVALEASSSGTWDWNVLTGEVTFGKEWLTSLGYQSQDILPTVESWENLVHPDDMPMTLQAINQHFSGDTQVYESINRLRMKNGEWRWNLDRGRVVEWTTDGKPLRMVGTDTNITERKEVEVALEESRNRFQAIFDDAGIGMALVDISGHFVESNRSFQTFLGYSAEDLRVLSFEIITYKEHVETNQNFFEELKTGTQDSCNMEKRYIRKDGQIVWGHLTVTTIRHASGELQFAIGMIEDITKKKLSEELLTKWATIFQHTQWGVAVGNADSHNLDLVNEAYARMHGYTVEELLGQPIAKVFAPSFRPQLPAFIQKIHAEGFQSIESLHLRKDGTTFPALLTVSAVKDSQGVVLYRVANLIDISNRKMAEESLQESEQRFRSMFEQAAVGVAQVNSNTGEFIRINQRYCDIVKYSQEEMMLTKFQDITHPADQLADLENMTKLLSGEIAKFSIEKRYVQKGGSAVWIHLTVSPMWQIGEQPSSHIAVVEDITERKMAKEALEQSERLANSTMNALTAQLCVLDESGQILSTNERWDQFARDNHGDPTKLGIGINYVNVCAQAAKKGNKDAELFLSGLNAVLTKQQSEFSMDYQCSSPRQLRWYSARVTRFPDPGPVRVVVSHTDITEQKSMEEAIRRQNEELETTVQLRTERIVELEQRRMQVEKLAALAQIAAGVAHEINNPLASISQSLVLLKRALSKDHPHYRYMAKTEDCIQRIAAITKNLYQLYRPSGPMPTLVDIRKCIQTAMEIMEERSAKQAVRIKSSSHSTPIVTHIAQSELIQVLCNLIHNAIDASVEGGTIELSLTTGPKAVVISVADEGEGIAPEAAAHIFEPFYTTKQNGSEGGMGLGLSISYSLVEAMNGSLNFSTTMGQGSTFVITLPRT